MKLLAWLITALGAYFLGCFNGAILTSRAVYHEDIRKKGSGNAGLTNYYRIYGAKSIALVVLTDVLKAVCAVLLGAWLFGKFSLSPLLGRYWGALWAVVGHTYPCFFGFRGGKGILCTCTVLVMLDWRIGLVGLGSFLAAFLLSRYVSLGSILAVVSFPITTFVVYRGESSHLPATAIALLICAVALWAHRDNVTRLLGGKENKFRFHVGKEEHK